MEECKCPKCGYKFMPEEREEKMEENENEMSREEEGGGEPFSKDKSSLAILIGKAMPKSSMKR